MSYIGRKMSELEFLAELFSRAAINETSGDQKAAYKYCLAAVFIMLCCGRHRSDDQAKNLEWARVLRDKKTRRSDLSETVRYFKDVIATSLRENSFVSGPTDETVEKLIQFARTRFDSMKAGKSLFMASELSAILNYKRFFGTEFLSDHHWVDLALDIGLIPTVPELLVFHDLKIIWNRYLAVRGELVASEPEGLSPISDAYFVQATEPDVRARRYELLCLRRLLLFLSVSFAEAYLYDVYYCMANMGYGRREEYRSVFEKKYVQDTEIVERVIFREFAVAEHTKELYQGYRETLKCRDRYVHASPFMDMSKRQSQLQPLLGMEESDVVRSLQTAVDFVLTLDKLLPGNLNVLYWWVEEDVTFRKLLPLTVADEERSRYGKIRGKIAAAAGRR